MKLGGELGGRGYRPLYTTHFIRKKSEGVLCDERNYNFQRVLESAIFTVDQKGKKEEISASISCINSI